MGQIDLEKTVVNVFHKIDAPVDLRNIQACHRLKSDYNGWSNEVIVKFSKHKDTFRVMNIKKSLKNVNSDGAGLSQALHDLLIVVFAVITSICGLNVKNYSLIN